MRQLWARVGSVLVVCGHSCKVVGGAGGDGLRNFQNLRLWYVLYVLLYDTTLPM